MNTDNNEMNLQSLIEKYGMKEGDEVLCTDPRAYSDVFCAGMKTLVRLRPTNNLCFMEGRLGSWNGTGADFTLPEHSPYLKATEEAPKQEFVRSCQANTKENQEALFELGYEWLSGTEVCHLGDGLLLYTNTSGWLTVGDVSSGNGDEPKRYSFKTVATLLPETPVESETQREIRLATEELEVLTKRLKALKEGL
tara:strand:- start:286 stop:870 length:585 start_codon:yes stop_codon:yes gene_type:complete